MKRLRLYIFWGICAVLLSACQKDGEDKVTPEEPSVEGSFEVKILPGGEFIIVDQEPLSVKSKGTPLGVLGIQIYEKGAEATEYIPYAYGIFDDWSELSFTAQKGAKYKFVATMVTAAFEKLYAEEGVFGKPFNHEVANAFIYSQTEEMVLLNSSETKLKDGAEYEVPSTDRYYGEKTDIIPQANAGIALFLKRVVFGVKYVISGLTSGEIVCEIAGAPAYTALSTTPSEQVIYCFDDLYGAYKADETEQKYSKTYRLKVNWKKNDGTTQVLAEQEVDFKRKMLTTLRMEITENVGSVNIVLEDQALGDGGQIGGSTGGDEVICNNVTLTTQQEVDEFSAQGYTKVTGTMTVDNRDSKITSLLPLLTLKDISTLTIKNFDCDNLEGLNHVESLSFFNLTNCRVTDLSALSKVNTLMAATFENVSSLQGLENLNAITSLLSITNCQELISLDGLSGIRQIGNLTISNSGIENTEGLQAVEYIQSINISGCAKYSSCHFPALKICEGYFFLSGVSSVSFPCLRQVGNVNITGSEIHLLDLSALEKAKDFSISDIMADAVVKWDKLSLIENNFTLKNCGIDIILEKLVLIGGVLSIDGNSNSVVKQKVELNNLTTIGGDVSIYDISSINLPLLYHVNTINIAPSEGCLLDLSALEEVQKDFFMSNFITGAVVKLNKLSVIGGSLRISNCNIDVSLAQLTKMGGNISIQGDYSNKVIKTKIIFDNLTSIGGSLEVQNLYNETFEAFPKLRTIDGNVNLGHLNNIRILAGLEELIQIGGGLTIDHCDKLEACDGLLKLQTIGGTFSLVSCSKLVNLHGFDNLTSVGGMNINYCSNLQNINDLSRLQYVEGNLSINSSTLKDFTSLSALQSIKGDLSIHCSNLSSLAFLRSTIIGGGVSIESDQLQTLEGLEHLTSINGALNIDAPVTSLSPLSKVTSIAGGMTIESKGLTDLQGMEALTTINGLSLYCSNLIDMSALSGLTLVDGDLLLKSLKVTEIKLGKLEQVNGTFSIESCAEVTSMSLKELTYIKDDLKLSGGYNSKLVSLPSFSSELIIGGYLEVAKYSLLTNISGLRNVKQVGRLMKFVDNTKLSDFCVLASFLKHENEIYASGNLKNPTKEDILGGNCR